VILPWNDLSLVERIVSEQFNEIAAIITEPIMCNNGCILPEEGFLKGLRDIYGAQHYFGVTPDLSIFAKAMGSGYPISALVGKKAWMKEIEDSRVIHAGTMNTSNATVAAALATIEVLEEERPYHRMHALGQKLIKGLRKAAEGTRQNLLVQGPGVMFHTAFTHLPAVKDYRDTLTFDRNKLAQFIAGMHDHGIRVIGRGLWYISAAHKEEDIYEAIEVANNVLKNV
jgi:glutamate-1-semialdehyde 2,1-aminomutase